MQGYNKPLYNASQYNAKVTNEYLTLADDIALDVELPQFDSVFLSELFAKAITDKVLPEAIELDDWLRITRGAGGIGFSDVQR